MREIVMDTETTGLDAREDRIVEIGAVELMNHLPTGATYHQYINPQRAMPHEAFQIHGLGDEFLSDKPVFASVAQAFLDFVADAPLVIHNAAFDMGMLNAEFRRLGQPPLPDARAVDTLTIARKAFPGAQTSLDALCRRFGIDNSAREKHGALLDSELLAEVYLELRGGRQTVFSLDAPRRGGGAVTSGTAWQARPRPEPLAPRLTPDDRQRHEKFIEELDGGGLWASYGENP